MFPFQMEVTSKMLCDHFDTKRSSCVCVCVFTNNIQYYTKKVKILF